MWKTWIKTILFRINISWIWICGVFFLMRDLGNNRKQKSQFRWVKGKTVASGTCLPKVTFNPVSSASVSLHVFLLSQWKKTRGADLPADPKKIGKRKRISPVCFGTLGMEPETSYQVHTLANEPNYCAVHEKLSITALSQSLVCVSAWVCKYDASLYRPVMNQSKISLMQPGDKFKLWITYQVDIYLDTRQRSGWWCITRSALSCSVCRAVCLAYYCVCVCVIEPQTFAARACRK